LDISGALTVNGSPVSGGGSFVGHRNYLTGSSSGTARVPIIYTGTTYDPGGMYNTSTGNITIPSAGKYVFNCCMTGMQENLKSIRPVLHNTTLGSANINTNAVVDFLQMYNTPSPYAQYFATGGMATLQCAANDKFAWATHSNVTLLNPQERFNYIETFKVG
jgi:hypothetical protein